jgi:hypothetical protein
MKGEARVAAPPPRFAAVGARRPPSSRVASAGPIRVSEANEDILLSGRERAEGFPAVCGAVAVAVAVPLSVPAASGPGFKICGAGTVSDAVTLPSHSERAKGFPTVCDAVAGAGGVTVAVAVTDTVAASRCPNTYARVGYTSSYEHRARNSPHRRG